MHPSITLPTSQSPTPPQKTTINTLHTQFKTYGRNAREWMRKCIMMLPAIDRERVWERKKFRSIHEYAGRLAGMSHDTVNDALRILRVAEHMPDIMKVIEERGINAVKPIVTLLTINNQKFWADKIRTMSQHTLQMYRQGLENQNERRATMGISVTMPDTPNIQPINLFELDIIGRGAPSETESFLQQQAIEIPEQSGTGTGSPIQKTIPMQLNSKIAAQLEKLKGQGDWNMLMQEFLEQRAKILQDKKPQPVTTSSRHIPAAIEKYIKERSRNTCEFQGCIKPYTILHHTQRFALEHIHNPDHIVALCTEHERLAHLTLIENEEEHPSEWRVGKEAERGLAGSRERAKYDIDQMVQGYRRPG